MSVVPDRIATSPILCPHCKKIIDTGQLITSARKGTGETIACFGCAFGIAEPLLRGEES